MASAQDFIQRMRAVQQAREEAFKPLAEILAQREELQRQLAALDAPYGEAFAAAEAAGWTAEELAAIGAEEPVKRPKGRPRTRRTTAKKAAPEVSTPGTAPASPTASLPAQEGAGQAAEVTGAGVSG
ncbi:hypothetical protein ACH5A3_39820 [Streptomyces echinatus]|uniref:hypothetical protein n=1 Tax=Streptomyces echinatus TaxID=67293 RepID=UPI0037AE122F